MTPDELRELMGELNRRYTEEEYALHSRNRPVKTLWEFTHAHNHELIELVKDWEDHLYRGGPKPQLTLSQALRPAHDSVNSACDRLKAITDHYARLGHGGGEVVPIAIYASRSTAELIARLEGLRESAHLAAAAEHSRAWFNLIVYMGDPLMDQKSFAERLNAHKDAFIAACSEHAKELSHFLAVERTELKKRQALNVGLEGGGELSHMVANTESLGKKMLKVVNRIDARGARRGKREEINRIQDQCVAFWEDHKNDFAVRRRAKGRVSHKDVFEVHARTIEEKIGVKTAEMFGKYINNSSNRQSAKRKRSLDKRP